MISFYHSLNEIDGINYKSMYVLNHEQKQYCIDQSALKAASRQNEKQFKWENHLPDLWQNKYTAINYYWIIRLLT